MLEESKQRIKDITKEKFKLRHKNKHLSTQKQEMLNAQLKYDSENKILQKLELSKQQHEEFQKKIGNIRS